MNLDIAPAAGMLFPGPVPLVLSGRRHRARELRVRHVAHLERLAHRLFPHPFTGLESDLGAVDALAPGDPARDDHLDTLWDASDRWPPRFGSSAYWKAVGTVGLAPVYLRLVLRDTRPRLTARNARGLATGLTAAEWIAVDGIAHGHVPRAAGDGGDGRGFDWRRAVQYLADPRRGPGLTPGEIGDLYLTQLFFLCGGPDVTYWVELPDRPGVPTSHHAESET